MTPAEAARELSRKHFMNCSLETDNTRALIDYSLGEAFREFADLLEEKENENA